MANQCLFKRWYCVNRVFTGIKKGILGIIYIRAPFGDQHGSWRSLLIIALAGISSKWAVLSPYALHKI